MAGRPKKMARRVEELEGRAHELFSDLCRVRPAQYAKRPVSERDIIGRLWIRSVDTMDAACEAITSLYVELADKAGLLPDESFDDPTPPIGTGETGRQNEGEGLS